MFNKNVEKTFNTIEMIAKSSVLRHFSVQTLTVAGAGMLALTVQKSDLGYLYKLMFNPVTMVLGGVVLGNAINDTFDTVLEKHDERILYEFGNGTFQKETW
jgi:hypothetical protein